LIHNTLNKLINTILQKCGAKVLLFSETAKDLHHFCIFYPKTFRHFKKNHLLCVWKKNINEQNKHIIPL